MKKTMTILLAFLMVTFGMRAQTTAMSYGFEDGDKFGINDAGTIDYVNFDSAWTAKGGTYGVSADEFYAGEKSFYLHTPDSAGAGNTWTRALKFRSLDLAENTPYRVSFWVKTAAAAKIQSAVMTGIENADMPIVAPTVTDGKYQEYNFSLTGFNSESWVRKSYVLYNATMAFQSEAFLSYGNTYSDTLPETYFFVMNLYSACDYYLDNIEIAQSSIKGVYFNGDDALRIDFGYPTNYAALLKGNLIGAVQYDAACVKVLVNNKEYDVESVELKEDGYLYLFLESETIDPDDVVSVSFTAPTENAIQYTSDYERPYWNTSEDKNVLSFENEPAFYESFEATSVLYEPAEFLSCSPLEGSFELPVTLKDFSATFNRNIDLSQIKAVLTGNGLNETLTVTNAADNFATTAKFARTGKTDLAKGYYTLTLSNIYTENGFTDDYNPTINLTYGVGPEDFNVFTPDTLFKTDFEKFSAGTIPDSTWTVVHEGTVREPGSSQGSGSRIFSFGDGGEFLRGLYFRSNGTNAGIATYNDPIALTAGTFQLISYTTAWKSAPSIKANIINATTGDTITSDIYALANGLNGSTEKLVNVSSYATTFTLEAATNVIVSYDVVQGDGMVEVMLFGFQFWTADPDAGDDNIAFADNFATTSPNYTPANWTIMADGGEEHVPGTDYNYNGTRVYVLGGTTNLAKGIYMRAWDASNVGYALYGDTTREALELNGGKYRLTYYGIGWKSLGEIVYTQIMDLNDNVIASKADTLNVHLDGNRDATATAQKSVLEFSAGSGFYKMKFFGEANNTYNTSANKEFIIGNFTLESIPSGSTYYKELLATAIKDAEQEQKNSSDSIYAGTTYNALKEAITYNKTVTYTHGSLYLTAIDTLGMKVSAMASRRENVDTYIKAIANAASVIANDSTANIVKAKIDRSYFILDSLYAIYAEVASTSLRDKELAYVAGTMANSYSYFYNMANTCIAVVTARINATADMAIRFGASETDSLIVAARAIITDNDALAKSLRKLAKANLYDSIAGGYSYSTYDADLDYTEADSLDLSFFVKNYDFYTTSTDRVIVAGEVPGWDLSNVSNVNPVWGWGAFAGSSTHPYTEAGLVGGWFVSFDAVQEMIDIPVGQYTIAANHWTNMDSTDMAIATTTEKNDSAWFYFDKTNQFIGTINNLFTGVEINDGYLKLIFNVVSGGGHSSLDKVRLYMTGKKDGFDYAQAAKDLREEVEDAIQDILAPAGKVVAVKYYNLNGIQVAEPHGMTIKMSIFDNGKVEAEKIYVRF